MRLLIVEDDQIIGPRLVEVLQEEKYAVDLATDYEAGLASGLANDYDVIIIDWMLPDGSGVDLCRELREEKVTTPILVLTARSQLEDKVTGLDAGADDYLTKPFEVDELLARVRALLRRKDEVVSDTLTIDDLTIDFGTRTVERGDVSIYLSPKEYGLLEFLARNGERVVDRMEILAHVWDENADMFTNTVDVHIRYLRKKIDDGRRPLIKTIKGKGYRLCID